MSVSVVICVILVTLYGLTAPTLGATTQTPDLTTDSATSAHVINTGTATNAPVTYTGSATNTTTNGVTSVSSSATRETTYHVTTPVSSMTRLTSSTKSTLTTTIHNGGSSSSTQNTTTTVATLTSAWQSVSYGLIGVIFVLLIAFIITIVCSYKLKQRLNTVSKTLYPISPGGQPTPEYLDLEIHVDGQNGNVELSNMNGQHEEEFDTPALPSTPRPAKPPRKPPPPPVSKPPNVPTNGDAPFPPQRRKRPSFKLQEQEMGIANPNSTEDEVDATTVSNEAANHVVDGAYEVPVPKSAISQKAATDNMMRRQDSSTGLPDLSPIGMPSIPKRKVVEPLAMTDDTVNSQAFDNSGIPEDEHFDDPMYFEDIDAHGTNENFDIDYTMSHDSFVDLPVDLAGHHYHVLEKQQQTNKDFALHSDQMNGDFQSQEMLTGTEAVAGAKELDDLVNSSSEKSKSKRDFEASPGDRIENVNEANGEDDAENYEDITLLSPNRQNIEKQRQDDADFDTESEMVRTGNDLRGSRLGKPQNTYFLDIHDRTDSPVTPEDIRIDESLPDGETMYINSDQNHLIEHQQYANQFVDLNDGLFNDQMQPDHMQYENFGFDTDDVENHFDLFNGTVPSDSNKTTHDEFSLA